MVDVTVISDETRAVDADVSDGRILVDPAQLPGALGWELKPEGLCRGDVCVPVRDPAEPLRRRPRSTSRRWAPRSGGRSWSTPTRVSRAVALDGETRRRALNELVAPSFELPDLDGNLHALEEWHDRKKLLVAFASW